MQGLNCETPRKTPPKMFPNGQSRSQPSLASSQELSKTSKVPGKQFVAPHIGTLRRHHLYGSSLTMAASRSQSALAAFGTTSRTSATCSRASLRQKRGVATLANFRIPDIKNEPNVRPEHGQRLSGSSLIDRSNTTQKARPNAKSSPTP